MINIYNEATKILGNENESSTILEIFKTGSLLFIQSSSDYDYVAICNGFTKRYKRYHFSVEDKKIDLIIIDTDELEQQFTFNLENRNSLYNYMYIIKEVVYGEYEHSWNMLEHKDEYLVYLKDRYYKTIGKLKSKTRVSKGFVHYYIILKIYENNKVDITTQMLNDIQILYNGGENVLPIINWIESELKE